MNGEGDIYVGFADLCFALTTTFWAGWAIVLLPTLQDFIHLHSDVSVL